LKKLRLVFQFLILAFFLWLILGSAEKYPIKLDLFCRVDPLLALTVLISSRSFFMYSLTSLGIIIFTAVFGRFFCGWICPMGTLTEYISTKKNSNYKFNFSKFKYYLLAFIFSSAVFGLNISYFFDPFTIITRGLAGGLYPLIQLFVRFLSDRFYDFSSSGNQIMSDIFYSLSDKLTSSRILSVTQMPFDWFASISLFIVILIVCLSFAQKRFWCRNLCPLGAFLGLLSRYSIFKRNVGSFCYHCKKCTNSCQTEAIDREDPKKVLNMECLNCFDCQSICPKNSIGFCSKTKTTSADLDKRRLLISAGTGIALASIANIDKFGVIKKEHKGVLRPPGAISESKFVNRCARCASCIKACPTNALHHAFGEAGVSGFLTPIVIPKRGYCKENCNVCSTVCPTEAIGFFDVEDKKTIRIGKAVVLKGRCLAWVNNKDCLICEEYCSYVAIHHTRVKDSDAPIVNENACVGCGQCEFICPVDAIIIKPLN